MSLIDTLERDEVDVQAEAWAKYREILSRDSDPKPTDGKALKKIMAALGIATDQLRRDLSVLKRAAALEAEAAVATDELKAETVAAFKAADEYRVETEKIAVEGTRRVGPPDGWRARQKQQSADGRRCPSRPGGFEVAKSGAIRHRPAGAGT